MVQHWCSLLIYWNERSYWSQKRTAQITLVPKLFITSGQNTNNETVAYTCWKAEETSMVGHLESGLCFRKIISAIIKGYLLPAHCNSIACIRFLLPFLLSTKSRWLKSTFGFSKLATVNFVIKLPPFFCLTWKCREVAFCQWCSLLPFGFF